MFYIIAIDILTFKFRYAILFASLRAGRCAAPVYPHGAPDAPSTTGERNEEDPRTRRPRDPLCRWHRQRADHPTARRGIRRSRSHTGSQAGGGPAVR